MSTEHYPDSSHSLSTLDEVLANERVKHRVKTLRKVFNENGVAASDGHLQSVKAILLVQSQHH